MRNVSRMNEREIQTKLDEGKQNLFLADLFLKNV